MPEVLLPAAEPVPDTLAPQVVSSRDRKGGSLASILILAVAALVNFMQPWQLGFYLDDWPTSVAAVRYGGPFSAERFQHLFDVDRSRPGLAVARFLFSSLLGDAALSWQLAMLLVNVGIAAALYLLIRALDDRISRLAAAAVASLWLVQPWLGANRFWIVLLPVNLVVLLFCLMCVLVIRGWKAGRSPWLAPGLVYLGCCLSYEAFYLQFIPLLLIGAAFVRTGRAKWTDVLRTTAALFVGQIGGAMYKAFGPSTSGMIRNPRLDVGAQAHSVSSFVSAFSRSFHEFTLPVGILAAVLAVVAVLMFWTQRNRALSESRGSSLIFAGCLAGAVICLTSYAIGGVAITSIGITSRATVFLGFWAVPAVAVAATEMNGWKGPLLWSARALAVALAIFLAGSYWMRERDWATAWAKQKEILSRVPLAAMLRIPADVPILYVGPQSVNGAPVFSATWDINTAVPMRYPPLAKHSFLVYNPWVGPWNWDGENLKAADTGSVVVRARALYLWQPELGRLFKVPQYTIINRDYSVTLPPFASLAAEAVPLSDTTTPEPSAK